MNVLTITLHGRPITKKNSQRIVRVGKFNKIIPSKAYVQYEKDCLKQITGDKRLNLAGKYNLKCLYYMPTRHRVDLVNLLEATCDVLVKANVIKDDESKIIASHDGCEVLYDKNNPRVEIEIKEVCNE